MKKMKKIMALMLAAIMMMAMSVTAFAAGTTCSLTVNVKGGQDLKGQTINLYKLFDVTESKSGETTNYAYTVNTANGYKEAIKTALGTSFTGITDEEYAAAVLALKDTEGAVQKFANDFTADALKKNLSATETSGKITEDSNKTSYTFNNLADGYYLVYVTGGKEIQSSLVTVDADTTKVDLKTEAPSIDKIADKTTVNIGDVVKYTVKGSIPDTTGYAEYVYKIHDELSTGLDFVNDATGTALETGATTVNVTVAFKDNSLTVGGTTPTTATLETANNRKMSLDLSEWVRANQTNKGKDFTVTYYAKVNKAAVVTEKNKAQLEYGNKPGETTTTTPSEAKTPTYPLDILKVKKGTEEILAGAHFTLYASGADGSIDETNPIKVTKDADGKYSYAADQASSDPSVITDMVTVATKFAETGYNLHINGLAAGTYYLKETQAPEGYNKLTDAIKVIITKSTTEDETAWTLTVDKGTLEGKIVKVENSTGSLLPSTGGRGAIAFAVIAAILVFGVAVSFIRDKRKEA